MAPIGHGLPGSSSVWTLPTAFLSGAAAAAGIAAINSIGNLAGFEEIPPSRSILFRPIKMSQAQRFKKAKMRAIEAHGRP
jgi:hypothetical protein